MVDYAEELLEGSTTTKQQEGKDYAEELLSGKPILPGSELIGGTYQRIPVTEPPTGDILTGPTTPSAKGQPTKPYTAAITGEYAEPEATKLMAGKIKESYIPALEPDADISTIMKAGMVDDPYIKAKIFSEARGIPITQYRVSKDGEIEFQTNQGTWQREISEQPSSKLRAGAIETLTHPSTVLATAGALMGPWAAAGGGALGEIARKGIAKGVYGEKIEPLKDIIDIGMQGIFTLGGEMIGKVVSGTANRFLSRRAGALRLAGEEAKKSLLTMKDHAKAAFIDKLARQHNMTLAPHQLYDKEGMTNMWKYLRKHPLTSDAVRNFEDALDNATNDAIDNFIREMGGYEETPFRLGEKTKKAAAGAIETLEARREAAAGPLYKEAFSKESFPYPELKVDITDAFDEVDRLMSETVKGDPSYTALKRIKIMLDNAEGDPRRLDRVKRGGIDAVLEKTKTNRTLGREMTLVKKKLTDAMDEQVPGYVKARGMFQEYSKPIDRLKDSVIGQLAKTEGDKPLSTTAQKLLNFRNMPDDQLLREARRNIVQQDPELWSKIVGGYIRDVYQELVVTEGGKIANVAGKLQKRLFGSEKQRRLMRAAMTPGQFKNFEGLMTVFQRAAIGSGSESMTAPFQAIAESMGKIPGSKIYRYAMFPKQATVETVFGKWNDIIVHGRQEALLNALTAPDVTKKLALLKRLSPKSQKFIEAFSVFTAMVGDKLGIGEIYESIEKQKQAAQQ